MSDKKTRETTTSEEKTTTMTTEEAILEIRSMQLKHDQDIKEMQLKHDQEVKEIQASLAANNEDTKRNIQMTMKMMEESIATWGTIRKEMHEMSRTFTEAKKHTSAIRHQSKRWDILTTTQTNRRRSQYPITNYNQ